MGAKWTVRLPRCFLDPYSLRAVAETEFAAVETDTEFAVAAAACHQDSSFLVEVAMVEKEQSSLSSLMMDQVDSMADSALRPEVQPLCCAVVVVVEELEGLKDRYPFEKDWERTRHRRHTKTSSS